MGVEISTTGTTKQWSIAITQNVIGFGQYNGQPTLSIQNQDALDDLGKGLGLENGDVLLKYFGKDIPVGPAINEFLGEIYGMLPQEDTFRMTVAREVDGEMKEIELTTPNRQVDIPVPLSLVFTENPTEEQLKLRKYWLEKAK